MIEIFGLQLRPKEWPACRFRYRFMHRRDISLNINNKRLWLLPGGAAIKRYAALNDKRHIITKDTDDSVAIYDVLRVVKKESLGKIDFEEEIKKRNKQVYIPNWFTVDLKTGVCKFQKNVLSK